MRTLTIPQYGSKPYIIVEVGGFTFTDGICSESGYAVAAGILDVSTFVCALKSRSMGTDSTVSVTLDTSVNALTAAIIGTTAVVKQGFVGATAITLFTGRVAPNIEINPDTKTISFDIESIVESGAYLKQTSDTGIYPWLTAVADGETWPLCFGSVIRVKAVPLKTGVELTSFTDLTLAATVLNVSDLVTVPMDTAFDFDAQHILCNGHCTSAGLVLNAINKIWYSNVSVTAVDGNKLTIADPTIDLENKWCKIGSTITFCSYQMGMDCYFNDEFTAVTSIDEVRGKPDASWGTVAAWSLLAPFDLVARSATDTETYIFNSVPTDRVAEVVGKLQTGRMTQISSSQYTLNLGSTPLPDGTYASTVTFKSALKDMEKKRWSGEVYVSLVSNIEANVTDVIAYLLTTYTNITCDGPSFAAVATQTELLPLGFSITKPTNALTTCESIAMLACCALTVKNGVAYLQYLPSKPADLEALPDLTDYIKDSCTETVSNVEQLVTCYIAQWTKMASEGSRKFQVETNIATYGYFEQVEDMFVYNVVERVKIAARFWAMRLGKVWPRYTLDLPLTGLAYELFDFVKVNGQLGQVVSTTYDSSTFKVTVEVEIGDANYWTSDLTDYGPLDPLDGIDQIEYCWYDMQIGGADSETQRYQILNNELTGESIPVKLALYQKQWLYLALYEMGSNNTDIIARSMVLKFTLIQPYADAGYVLYNGNGEVLTEYQMTNGLCNLHFYVGHPSLTVGEEKSCQISITPKNNPTVTVGKAKVSKYSGFSFAVSVDSTIHENVPIEFVNGETYLFAYNGPANGTLQLTFASGFQKSFTETDGSAVADLSEVTENSGHYETTLKYVGTNVIADVAHTPEYTRLL